MRADAFLEDDYTLVNERFFKALRANHAYRADPSGWVHAVWCGTSALRVPRLDQERWHRYQIDQVGSEPPEKELILSGVATWINQTLSTDELTLCNSATAASFAALIALRELGLSRVCFETPAYFGSIEQARALGLEVTLAPSYLAESFDSRHLRHWVAGLGDAPIVWLTQPRFGLGTNQDRALINTLLEELPPHCFIVIDEAFEQEWPSRLDASCVGPAERIIRLRSLTKGIGLNGVRLACVVHAGSLRRSVSYAVELVHGGLDLHALQMGAYLFENTVRFRGLLDVARGQVNELWRRAGAEAVGAQGLQIIRIENGYLGALAVKRPPHIPVESFRDRLLSFCCENACPVILGASLYFAADPDYEFVRLSYYTDPCLLLEGVRILRRFWTAASEDR